MTKMKPSQNPKSAERNTRVDGLIDCPYCETPIDEHKATNCLDLWVAQDVLKWELWTEYLYSNLKNSSDPKIGCQYLISPHAVQDIGIKESSDFWNKATEIIPDTNLVLHPQKRFSSFIEDAWGTLMIIDPSEDEFELLFSDGWIATFRIAGKGVFSSMEPFHPEVAICRAALKAVAHD